MARPAPFDPIAIIAALEEHRVRFIVIGALGRVIHGSGELTDGIDIVPSPKDDNLERLELALDDLQAHREDGKAITLEKDLAGDTPVDLRTAAGEMSIVLEPAGTRGYDDLRRGANREPLGQGVRPEVASAGDHARMLASLNRERDLEPLKTMRRLIELERARTRSRTQSRGRGIGLER